MNAAEIIKKDLDAIYIGNLSTVDDDLTLPENGKYGAQFTWETGEERFIDNTGKVLSIWKFCGTNYRILWE